MIRALKVAKYFPSLELIIWRKIVWWSKMWNLEQSSSRYLRYSPVIPICDILLKWSKSYKLIIFCFSVIQSSFYLIGTQATRQNKTNILRQADRKGGGGDQPDAKCLFYFDERKQMWKFGSFFSLKFYSLTLKTHFISMWRVSKMHFSCPFRGCQNEEPHGHTTSLRPTHKELENVHFNIYYTPPYWFFLV